MVVLAKGYRVVPQALSDSHGRCEGFRHLHLKEHRGVFKVTAEDRASNNNNNSSSSISNRSSGDGAVFAKGKTLFVGNVDDQGGRLCRREIEDRLRRALSPLCGDVAHISVSRNDNSGNDGASGARGLATARFAHVCFLSAKGVQRALALENIPSGVSLETPLVRLDGEEEDGEADKADPEGEESRDENGDASCGYAALIQRHRRGFPPRAALQAEVDSSMQRFEQEEAAEAKKRKELLENPEGDDGFVTVTYKRKRGRSSNPSTEGGVSVDNGIVKEKGKGARELTDFYRFQMRETRREQLATLRSKFEQDKARVAKMKEQRKFKPF